MTTNKQGVEMRENTMDKNFMLKSMKGGLKKEK